jgi:hypothetical protein
VGVGVGELLVVGDGLALPVGEGEVDDGVGDGVGEPVDVADGLGDEESRRTATRRDGVVDGDGWPPIRPPTLVPVPFWCQTTASSGLPSAASNTVMPPTTPTKIPRLATVRASQPGRPRSHLAHVRRPLVCPACAARAFSAPVLGGAV